jgi:type I restriction enzyme M protein
MKLANILKDSNYKLSQFTTAEIDQLEQSITLKPSKNGDVAYVTCLVRQKAIKLTPEEAIRQLYLQILIDRLHYPVSRIQVEYGVNFGREVKRADIVVMDKDRPNTVYMLVELKKPKLKDGKDQLRSYCNATGAPIGVWTNGDLITQYQRKDPNFFEPIPALPSAHQTLADVLQKRFTLDDLKKISREETQQSLKEIIREMEDEVLANAGVDVFEEVFKLIFTKLYDEWASGRKGQSSKRQLEFFNSGQTETELKDKIQALFNKAKGKWSGVFKSDEKISLTGSHLSVCVSYLELRKLFNSNLDVVDEAFEYLINQSSKGEKGQYFTPRYVIDMCVKMLNPKEHEFMIDPAAGSSGFPVHTMFHVWRQIYLDEGEDQSDMFTAEEKLPRCEDYVEEKVFAIDFDEKAVRVARTLNLIAGDGQTNVLHLNTLDYKRWKERLEDDDWQGIYGNGFRRLRQLQAQKDDYKGFKFDIVMANPPFAGDIKESLIISSYELTRDKAGKAKGVGRDILFIERNLDFLKPGGRMAIVLPQGRFNNSSDKSIREFMAERCRILAVVGLHGNTFKPHTGTKTSVLFMQKWNDDPQAGALCPRQEDYNIFFATMQKSGKDNSGDKIWRKISSSTAAPPDELAELKPSAPVQRVEGMENHLLQDGHGHLVVDHDLYNHEGLTEDGIAEAFIEFAKKEKLSFFEPSPSVTPFDAARYQQLMDGLEAVEIAFTQVQENNDALRFDSDFFKKSYLTSEAIAKQKKWFLLKDQIQSVKSFGAYSLCNYIEYLEEGVPFLRCVNIKNSQVDFSDVIYIDEKSHELLWKSEVKPGTVLLTMSGSAGNVAIAHETWEYPINSNQDIAKVDCSGGINPYYLYGFLITDYGFNQIQRQLVGSVQQHIFLWQIENLFISDFNSDFQEFIEKLIKFANSTSEKSKLFYQQAEDLLLSELGLQDWQPTEETVAVKSFAESFLSSGRLDAEYYQPKQQKVMSIMRQSGLCIGDVVSLAKRKFQTEQEGTFNYIEIGSLSGESFANSEVVAMEEAPSRAQWIVKTNDVITSTVRPIRRLSALIEPEQSNYICSSGFAVLKPTQIEPEVLLVYLRSPIVCEILDLHTTASMYPAISTEDLLHIPITLPEKKTRQKIAEKVRESRKAREQSKQLLEIAKTGVERAIETDEATATIWINQQLEALNIKLN